MVSMSPRQNTEVTDVVSDWETFLKRQYNRKERVELSKEFPHKRSFYIDYRNLEAFGKRGLALADELIERPEKVMNDVKDALVRLGIIEEKDRRLVHVRFMNLTRKTKIRDIRANQINTFVAVEGILRKTTEVRPRIVAAVFKCLECGQLTPPYSQTYGRFQDPFRVCATCQKKTPLELVPEKSEFLDAQKLRIQESPEGLRGGEQPQTIDVDVTDDLTGSSAPGDRVVITGILRSFQRINAGTKSTLFDIYLECNAIEVAEKEFEEVNISEEDEAEIHELSKDPKIYSKIARSIAPTIYGNTDVKEAVALQLFGGIPKEMPDSSRLRGDIHVLLVGDPGIAKSQLLRYIVQLSPRGIYTSGKSSTSAGLTATAVKDEFGDGRWTLEAGALVLADMGMAAVDELDKMDKEDRSALHEAMEQQCYDDQTEVLTEHGWRLFRDVEEGERVATLTPDGRLTYAVPTAYVAAEYDGDMYFISSRQVDLAVTPNHNMYVDLNRRADEWEGFGLRRMETLPLQRRMRFKKNAIWEGMYVETYELPSVTVYKNQNHSGEESGAIALKMDDWLEFLGYYLSEGSVQYTNGVPYRVHISQRDGVRAAKMTACTNRLGFRWSYNGQNIAISSKQLATHLAVFGKCHEKYVPQYAKEVCPEQIRILLDALVLGDDWVRKGTGQTAYVTSSRQLADDMTELLLKAGISGNTTVVHRQGEEVRVPEGRRAVLSHDIYQVSFIREGQNRPSINTNGLRHITKGHYAGMIYCVEVPDHVIYVRRKGKPVWCGNTVSIAKAGITATLRSRCALLGAANPKMGRFDEYAPISEQINMPPSLLSRFDLIFIMTDKPDGARDLAIAEHILKSHAVGELIEKKRRMPVEGVDDAYIQQQLKPVTPDIEPLLFRKYIAYAKRTCFPTIVPEAREALRDYYLQLRKLADNNKPVPVTARQLEALVRLGEASARIRLSPTVDIEDAQRVIKIVDTCLRQVAYDAESGTFDIDKWTTGISKRQRDIIRTVKEVIKDVGGDEGSANVEQVIEEMTRQGFAKDKVEATIRMLKNEGEVVELRPGIIKLFAREY